ncbi:MAG: hypothetical protein K2F85_01380 [Helicobacter sp.]|nr:hypothetical protein [Helicobacter sp.]
MGILGIDNNIEYTIETRQQDRLTLDSTAEEVRAATPEARREWAKAMAKRSNELITEEEMEQLRELIAQRQKSGAYSKTL